MQGAECGIPPRLLQTGVDVGVHALKSFRRKCSCVFSPVPAWISVSGLEFFVHFQALCAMPGPWQKGQGCQVSSLCATEVFLKLRYQMVAFQFMPQVIQVCI